MLNDYVASGQIYLAMGHTDLRKGIDGLGVIIQEHYGKEIKENDIFIFCGRRNDRIKALLWEGDGFLLLYKRLEKGTFRWPRNTSDLAEINAKQYRNLMHGLEIELNKIPRQKLAPKII
ncbi:MAG: IS66 family insertion sequence element accessory protein TnpB [Synergistaceae bacterium]|nr:IS66 family insertion sequence element accessory protein TnpB [Synergistaceae bacterium]MDD4541654.1 IS66 family insertion sequence element accessory protein TnpB [Eubacteriales bacterium]